MDRIGVATRQEEFSVFVSEHLIHVYSRKKSVEYTYLIDIICSKCLINHFFISAQLDNCDNKLCVISDIENQSDHLPLCMSITLPVCDIQTNSTRQFVPKPKWFMTDAEILQRYKSELDSVLKTMSLPLFVSQCNVKLCSFHDCHIQLLHDHIINTLLTAGQRVIPFTKPSKGSHKKGCPGWNECVALDFDQALHWHLIYLDHGCPSFGFIFEMRNLHDLYITGK